MIKNADQRAQAGIETRIETGIDTGVTNPVGRIEVRVALLSTLLSAAIAGACSVSPTPPAPAAAAPPQVTSVSTSRSVLSRSLHPVASRPELDRGRHDPAAPVSASIHFKLSARQQADREALLAAVQDPTSPHYHQWLTPETYGARFGARPADIARVKAWLESQGLTVDPAASLGARLQFHGATGQVEAAFRTELHDYLVGGKVHRAMAIAPSVPSDLAGVVLGLHGVNDFRPVHAGHGRAVPADEDGGGTAAMGPSDMRTLYNLTPLLSAGTTGDGVSIIVVGQGPVVQSDLLSFRQQFQNSEQATFLDVLVPNTGITNGELTDDGQEAALDIEWAGAAAPAATLINVHTGYNEVNQGVTEAVAYVLEQGRGLAPELTGAGPMILSESWVGCDIGEESTGDVLQELGAAANLQGITYLVASGDEGATACIGDGLGALSTSYLGMPGVTTVGGTELPPSAQVPPFVANNHILEYPISGGVPLEAAWNDSVAPAVGTATTLGASASGGGPSHLFRKPLYQLGVTVDDGARDTPDVALNASPFNFPYQIIYGGQQWLVGGTSGGTPVFAGILALLNQSLASKGNTGGLGNVNPALYGLARSAPAAFHDIVTGNNVVPCSPTVDPQCPASASYGGFSAGPGYDLVTGLGSVDATALVNAWSALLPTSTTLLASTQTTSVGVPISLTAIVTSTGTQPVRGTVSFVFESQVGAGVVANGTSEDGGALVESYLLGSVALTPLPGNPSKGTATLSVAIPPGAAGLSDVAALYNGDSHYLSSQSQTPMAITVAGSTLAISPPSPTVQPGSMTLLTATGGTPPVSWGLHMGGDTACANETLEGGVSFYQCSDWRSTGPTTALFKAAGGQGTVTLPVVDAVGEVALVTVTIVGDPVDGGSLPEGGPGGGPPEAPPLEEGGTPVPYDAGQETPVDGGHAPEKGSSSSGGCAVANVGSGLGEAAFFPWLLGAVAFGVRRRRSARS